MDADGERLDVSFETVFDRIAVISLTSRTDRRREVASELARLELRPGVGKVRFFDAVRPSEAAGFPTIGARGCFLSHLTLLEESARTGVQSLLILEDDVGFVEHIDDRMRRVCAALLQDEWSVFYGGYGALPESAVAEPDLRPLVAVDPDDAIGQTHCIGLRGPAIAEAAAYLRPMLSRPAGSPEGGPMHVDGAYSWYRKAHPGRRTLAARPALAYQRPSRSDIFEHLAWYDRIGALRPIMSELRRWKGRLTRS
jgi:hypothetical protein